MPMDADADFARGKLLPPWRAVQDWPPMALSEADTVNLRNGQRIAQPSIATIHGDPAEMAVLDHQPRSACAG